MLELCLNFQTQRFHSHNNDTTTVFSAKEVRHSNRNGPVRLWALGERTLAAPEFSALLPATLPASALQPVTLPAGARAAVLPNVPPPYLFVEMSDFNSDYHSYLVHVVSIHWCTFQSD